MLEVFVGAADILQVTQYLKYDISVLNKVAIVIAGQGLELEVGHE